MSTRRYFGRAALAVASTAVIAACSADTPTSPPTASFSLTAAPTIGLSPTRLSFIYYALRRSQPPSQTLKITNLGGRRLTWKAASNRLWLKLSPKTGTAPSTVTVSIDPAGTLIGLNGYRPSSLQGSITVSALGASNTPQIVPLTLWIRYY
jgi:hypothetical protein